MTLHRKIKHNEEVCRAHDLGSYVQGQGRSQVRGQNLVSAITQKLLKQIANLTKHHRKIEHNEKVCRAQGPSGAFVTYCNICCFFFVFFFFGGGG